MFSPNVGVTIRKRWMLSARPQFVMSPEVCQNDLMARLYNCRSKLNSSSPHIQATLPFRLLNTMRGLPRGPLTSSAMRKWAPISEISKDLFA